MQSYTLGLATGGSVTTNSTTTFVDVPSLSFNVAAGGTYRFQAFLIYQGSTTAAQFGPVMGGTCTATFIVYGFRVNSAGTDGATNFVRHALLPSGAGSASAVDVATSDRAAIGEGLIVVNAAGTLTVAARHTGAACTVQAGGRFFLEQIA